MTIRYLPTIKDKVIGDEKMKMKGGQQKCQINNKVTSQTTYYKISVTSNGYERWKMSMKKINRQISHEYALMMHLNAQP